MADNLTQTRLVRLASQIFGVDDPGVQVGVGQDDCAVVIINGTPLLLTCDLRNHRRYVEAYDPIDYREMGAFVVKQNCSDIYGSGGVPLFFLLAVVFPAEGINENQVVELFEGVREEAAKHGMKVVGGDTKEGTSLVVGGTVVGSLPGEPWLLSGARPGDQIFVSGQLGGVTAAIALLELARAEYRTSAIEVIRKADLKAECILALHAAGIRCGTDISDGLARSLHNIMRCSGVGVEIDAAAIPRHPITQLAAQEFDIDSQTFSFGYGGDFAFIVTAPPSLSDFIVAAGFTRIGLVNSSDIAEVQWNGERRILPDFGHDDFTGTAPGARFIAKWMSW